MLCMGAHRLAGGLPGPAFARGLAVDTDSWGTRVNRRAFAQSMAGVIGAVAGFPAIVPAFAPDVLVLGVMRPLENDSFARGVAFGAMEAAQTAKLVRKSITTVEPQAGPSSRNADRVAALVKMSAQVVIGHGDDAHVREIARACDTHRIVFFNCGSRSDNLRRALCARTTFHIDGSAAMYAGAARQSPAGSKIVLWDSRLEKYGAAQLNDRFTEFADRPMDGSAWAGWVAVKIAWESFLRAPNSMVSWLTSDAAQFDGHKGSPLSFRRWDGQLRQPLYAVAARVTDVPDVARSTRPIREVLDTIGDPPGIQSCRIVPRS
jgi:hypothetical protein